MNVIYYLDYFPKISQSFVLNEIYELNNNGHNIAVFALNSSNQELFHNEYFDLDIPINYFETPSFTGITELFSTRAIHPRFLNEAFYRAPLKSHVGNVIRAKRCIEFIDTLEWDPDLVHTHFASLTKFGGKYASEFFQIPFTITTHAYDIYREPVGNYTTNLLRGADRIVTISEYNKEYIKQEFTPGAPIDVVRAGVKLNKFQPSINTKPNRILSIARFVEKKGLSYALDAIDLAVDDLPEIEYHIIGSGGLKSNLVQKVEELGIEENVVFLGSVSDERLIAELDEARCFLLPCVVTESGDRDGIPVALMEAMAMKTPPVSTSISGIPELIDHKVNGILTEPRNPEQSAEAVVSLLQNESIRRQYAERARKKILDEFNIERETQKLETTFRAAITEK